MFVRSALNRFFLLAGTGPLLTAAAACAFGQSQPADPCKELPQVCRQLPSSIGDSSKLLRNGGPMNNLPGLPSLGSNLNALQNFVLTTENTSRTIAAMAGVIAFEQAHPEALTAAPPVDANQFRSPQELATFLWTRIPEEAAILKQNGLSPVDFQFTIHALKRAKGGAENARTPRQIATYCNTSLFGGGCTLQQVQFVREHYAELKAQWNSFDVLRLHVDQVWTQPY